MGRMAVNPLAAAVVSRAVSIVPRRRRRYIMESDPGPTDRPMDQARAEKGREGGTENTDVNCIPSRGKKSILFGIRNERGNERGQVLPRESNHRRACAAGNASHFRCRRGDHASIFNHFAESGIRESAFRFKC